MFPIEMTDLDARLRAHLKALTETPAPPYAEGARGELVATVWRRAGLVVDVDDVGNVITDLPGGSGPRVMLAAHLDSVFPAGTDLRVREVAEDRWEAPGIGDDAAGLALLLALAEDVARPPAADRAPPRPRLTLVATVGEEGLGDLRGARRVMADRAATTDVFVAVDGHLGQVVDAAVGSRRIEARFRARGGHAWGDHGAPSAVHALGDAIHALTRVAVPRDPRSSLNVGLASGGSSVNAIAEEASLTVDLRSLAPGTLDALVSEAQRRLRTVARRHGVEVAFTPVGDRPAGRTADARLVAAARGALARVEREATVAASSTDANAAVAAGIAAIGFGVAVGGDAHRLSEWLDPRSLTIGYAALGHLLGELAES